MVSSWVVALLLAAAPQGAPPREVAVVSVVWPGAIDPPSAERLEEVVRGSLARLGTPLLGATEARAARETVKQCVASQSCLARVGAELGASVLVRVEPAAVSRDVAVLVQAIDTGEAKSLAELSVTVPAGELEVQLARALTTLASVVHARQVEVARSAVAAPGADAPVVTRRGEGEVHAQAPGSDAGGPLRAAGLVAGSVGLLVALGGGVLFAVAGTVTKDAHGNVFADQASRVPGIQQRQTAGLAVTGGGAALAVVGAVVWAMTAPRAPVTVAPGPGGVVVGGRF